MPKTLPTTLNERQCLTLAEAAAVYREDETELSRLFKIGAIPAQWRGRYWLVSRAHMEEYVRAKAEAEAKGRKRQKIAA